MKKIVWDWNGTLFNDLHLCFSCINRLLENHSLQPLPDIDAYRNVFGFPIVDYYQRIGFDFNQTPFSVLAKEYMEDYQSKSIHCSLYSDVMETIETVEEKKTPQVILSASKKAFLMAQIEQFSVKQHMDGIYGIEDIYAHSKVELAQAYRKENPRDELWFVGDSIHDYEVAQAIDAHCVLVASGHQAKYTLEKMPAPVVDQLSESLEYIYERD